MLKPMIRSNLQSLSPAVGTGCAVKGNNEDDDQSGQTVIVD